MVVTIWSYCVLRGQCDSVVNSLRELRPSRGARGYISRAGINSAASQLQFWVARSEVLRKACEQSASGTPFGVPQSVPPNLWKQILGSPCNASGPRDSFRAGRSCLIGVFTEQSPNTRWSLLF